MSPMYESCLLCMSHVSYAHSPNQWVLERSLVLRSAQQAQILELLASRYLLLLRQLHRAAVSTSRLLLPPPPLLLLLLRVQLQLAESQDLQVLQGWGQGGLVVPISPLAQQEEEYLAL